MKYITLPRSGSMPGPVSCLVPNLIPRPRPHCQVSPPLHQGGLAGPRHLCHLPCDFEHHSESLSHCALPSYETSIFMIPIFFPIFAFPSNGGPVMLREGRKAIRSGRGKVNGSPERAEALPGVNQQARREKNPDVALGSHCQAWGWAFLRLAERLRGSNYF